MMELNTVMEGAAGLMPPTPVFPWPTLPVDRLLMTRLTSYLAECRARRIGYRLGEKAHVLTAFPPDYSNIDCSGWVRAALAYATESAIILPDGSVDQHDWCENVGLKSSTRAALSLTDDRLRIGFITPTVAHRIGHVYLARNGVTFESHGGRGPDSRSVSASIEGGRLCDLTSAVYVLGGPA